MFWWGLLLALIGGLISISLVRRITRKSFPLIHEHHLDIIFIVILLLGLGLSAIDHAGDTRQANKSRELLIALRDYSYVARLDPSGHVLAGPGSGLEEITPITEILEGTYEMQGNYGVPKCDEMTLAKYRKVIQIEPRFPFSYYAIAVCLYQKGDDSWYDYANKALEIFHYTTMIADHHPSHDQAQRVLQSYCRTLKERS